MLSFPLSCRSHFPAVPTFLPFPLSCRSHFPAVLSLLSLLVLAVPCAAQYPGGGGSGGSSGGYPGAGTDAGYYGLATYSGGTVTAVSGQTTPFAPDGSEYYTGSGTASASTDPNTGASNNCSVNVSGPLTANFQWTPTDPSDTSTPSNTIVVQTATVSWNASLGGNATASGNADPGTGNPVPPSTSPNSQTWTDSKYTVESGGNTVSVSMSPFATFSGSSLANEFDSYLYGNAKITYKAHVYVPFIKITGVNAAYQALTGQQINAHLNTNGAPITITSYTWSFTGGTAPNPIKNWDPFGKAADGVTPQQLFPLTSTDLTGTDTSANQTGVTVADLNFYDQTADMVTVKCVVNFTFPAVGRGRGRAKSGSVTVMAKLITFLKPTASWVLQTVPANQQPVQRGAAPGFFTDNSTVMLANTYWDPITITDPPGFTGGEGGLAQIATFDRTFRGTTLDTGTAVTYVDMIKDSTGKYFHPGAGLDGNFTYPLGYPDNNGQAGALDTSKPYEWDISVLGHSSDTPTIGLKQDLVDGTGSLNAHKYYANVNDSFSTYLMFQPPGGIWVPLQMITWSWGGTANLPLNATQWNVTNPQFTSPKAAQPTDVPPSWSLIIPPGIQMIRQ